MAPAPELALWMLLALSAPIAAQALTREAGWRWTRFALRTSAYLALALAVAQGALLAGVATRDAAVLGAVAVASAAIVEADARWLIIPDVGWAIILIAGALRAGPEFSALAMGLALAGGLFLGVRLLFQALRGVEGLGWGDVKLAAAMGALLGPFLILPAVAFASGATALALLAHPRLRAAAPLVEGKLAAPLGVGLALAAFGALAYAAAEAVF